jgi:hypothetical protein
MVWAPLKVSSTWLRLGAGFFFCLTSLRIPSPRLSAICKGWACLAPVCFSLRFVALHSLFLADIIRFCRRCWPLCRTVRRPSSSCGSSRISAIWRSSRRLFDIDARHTREAKNSATVGAMYLRERAVLPCENDSPTGTGASSGINFRSLLTRCSLSADEVRVVLMPDQVTLPKIGAVADDADLAGEQR